MSHQRLPFFCFLFFFFVINSINRLIKWFEVSVRSYVRKSDKQPGEMEKKWFSQWTVCSEFNRSSPHRTIYNYACKMKTNKKNNFFFSILFFVFVSSFYRLATNEPQRMKWRKISLYAATKKRHTIIINCLHIIVKRAFPSFQFVTASTHSTESTKNLSDQFWLGFDVLRSYRYRFNLRYHI